MHNHTYPPIVCARAKSVERDYQEINREVNEGIQIKNEQMRTKQKNKCHCLK